MKTILITLLILISASTFAQKKYTIIMRDGVLMALTDTTFIYQRLDEKLAKVNFVDSLLNYDLLYGSDTTLFRAFSDLKYVSYIKLTDSLNLIRGAIALIEAGSFDTTFVYQAIAGKEPLKGADDNYVTDAEKIVIGNTSGTNTGDQTNISGNAGTVTNGVYTTDVGTVFLSPTGDGSGLTGITADTDSGVVRDLALEEIETKLDTGSVPSTYTMAQINSGIGLANTSLQPDDSTAFRTFSDLKYTGGSGLTTADRIKLDMMWADADLDSTAGTPTIIDQTDVGTSTNITSAKFGIATNDVVRVSVDSARYKVKYTVGGVHDWSGWLTDEGIYKAVDSAQVQHCSSSSASTQTNQTFYVSGYSDVFSVTTAGGSSSEIFADDFEDGNVSDDFDSYVHAGTNAITIETDSVYAGTYAAKWTWDGTNVNNYLQINVADATKIYIKMQINYNDFYGMGAWGTTSIVSLYDGATEFAALRLQGNGTPDALNNVGIWGEGPGHNPFPGANFYLNDWQTIELRWAKGTGGDGTGKIHVWWTPPGGTTYQDSLTTVTDANNLCDVIRFGSSTSPQINAAGIMYIDEIEIDSTSQR